MPEVPEHIFPATQLTRSAIRWKEAVATENHAESHRLLEEIVVASEPMFRRFAQHEGFDRTVSIERLISVAQEKVVRWLQAWQPDKSLFSFFTTCAKNAFRSECNKELAFRRRHHVTSDNLEKFFGAEEHGVDKRETAAAVDRRIQELQSRWGSPQEIGTLRYIVECIVDSPHDKVAAQKAAMYAWGLSPDMVKFFWNWALMEMRNAFYDQVRTPFTEQDLVRHAHSYTHLPDLLNIITFDQFKKMVAVMGGTRLRIPTIAQLAKLNESHRVWVDIEATDGSPAAVESAGRRHGKSARTAQEIYDEMSEVLNEDRSGEYPIFDDIHESVEDEDEIEDDE